MAIRTLKHFILQQECLNLYRHAIRASRNLGHHPQARREALGWIRKEIERTSQASDTQVIEDKLRQMRREIKQLF